ncbi:BC1881 family protein [Maledivibacter halophilus]|uniref:Mu transposase, C-terminal n=1 Tax=Maledivibacter halophilus TaxID=36842 RepID=A0A1T5KXN9_9FIRM|nr:BC1881 family protein [Maledivibacter halophilus]SKC68582.1 Mu transposase, C-terminal [Maledivibacter halophilus]SKC71573.1 Mu transposase, C-terminal [Maledivibacter halophilus]SKC80269.1 Mu transposase, C-terminal [Maledivibacter halophilus]
MDRRNVTYKGIRYKGKMYWNDLLKTYIGEQVYVMTSQDNSFINVYEGKTFLCKAKAFKKPKDKKEDDKTMLGFGKKLKDYKTTELIKELQSRKHVTIAKMKKEQQFKFRGDNKHIKEWGPAVVLVIRNAQ